MAKNYDQLTTDSSRHVNYRARRHSPNEALGPTKATVLLDGKDFDLHDIAMNSLSFIDDDQATWTIGCSSDVLIRVNDKELYQGSSEVARLEQSTSRVKVALKITDGFIDLPMLRHSLRAVQFETNMSTGTSDYREKLPREYLDIVYDFSHCLSFYKTKMDQFETEMQEHSEVTNQTLVDLAKQCREHFSPKWEVFCQKASQSAKKFDKNRDIVRLAKQFTEEMITRSIISAPLANRCYNKPLGYPGDYLSMLHIYEDNYVGETSFAAMIHKLMSELGLAAGVRTRKDSVFEMLRDAASTFFENNSNDESFTATSLGCGPAIEIADFAGWLASSKHCQRSVEWTLIDQEERALSHAYSGAHKTIGSNTPNFQARCVYLSFLQMLRETESLLPDESQNIIYSVGLFDYLKKKQSQRLIKNLLQKVKPGGQLIVCNAVEPNADEWFAEYVLDWTLIYRTSDDMTELAGLIDNTRTTIKISGEASNAYHFLTLTKSV